MVWVYLPLCPVLARGTRIFACWGLSPTHFTLDFELRASLSPGLLNTPSYPFLTSLFFLPSPPSSQRFEFKGVPPRPIFFGGRTFSSAVCLLRTKNVGPVDADHLRVSFPTGFCGKFPPQIPIFIIRLKPGFRQEEPFSESVSSCPFFPARRKAKDISFPQVKFLLEPDAQGITL